MTVQALQRAVGDKTTVARHSWTKAFGLANILDPQKHFGHPLIPVSMSSSLAALLEKHPSLPLQGASGLLATVSQFFKDYGVEIEDSGKGSSKASLRDRSPDSPRKGKSKGARPWSNWQTELPTSPRGKNAKMMTARMDLLVPLGLHIHTAVGQTGVPARRVKAEPHPKAVRVVEELRIFGYAISVFTPWE